MITLQGRHFASRVASSLLAAIRKKLSQDRVSEPLFDTPRFARNLEGAYKQMWQLYLAGEKPRKIDVVDGGR